MGSTPVGIYSASGISAILGLNPYKTRPLAWQECMEKLKPGFNAEKGYVLPPFPDSPPIRWGNAFEDAIIKLAEERGGHNIDCREKCYTADFDDIMLSCHVDGEFVKPHSYHLHEGKTTWSRAFYSTKGEDCEVELELYGETETYVQTEYKRRWGDPGTDMVPEEYQIQAAVQRICTGSELVKLSVLVFPKSTQDFEDLGWEIINDIDYGYLMELNHDNQPQKPDRWARAFAQIGNFHTYNLPTNKKLEDLIIEKVQEFDARYVKTELPPEFEDYSDVRRLMTQPMGTIKATPEMITKAAEYSEIVRQMGANGPMKKRQEALKVEIMNWMNTQRKDDWSTPPDKLILIDPNGGETLITFGAKFTAKKA